MIDNILEYINIKMSKLKEISFEKEKKVINKMVELFKQTRE